MCVYHTIREQRPEWWINCFDCVGDYYILYENKTLLAIKRHSAILLTGTFLIRIHYISLMAVTSFTLSRSVIINQSSYFSVLTRKHIVYDMDETYITGANI